MSETRQLLIFYTEQLLRTKGYAAFSYADLASAVGIRKASIHYHFPLKEDLAFEVVHTYLQRFNTVLEEIKATHHTCSARLQAYSRLFSSGREQSLLPLCAAMGAELSALPDKLQTQTKKFFAMHLEWIEQILKEGVAAEEITVGNDLDKRAYHILSYLEGASLVNWTVTKPCSIDPEMLLLLAKASIYETV